MLTDARPRRWGLCVLTTLLFTALLVPAAPASPALAAPGAGRGELFTPLPGFRLSRVEEPRVGPSSYAAYDVDVDGLESRLESPPAGAPTVRVSLPDPDGRPVAFDVAADSILEPALAARHPEIATYAGRAVADPTRTVRLDVTPLGLHASVRSPGGARAWYVDPATTERGATEHLSYYRSALPEPPAFEEVEPPGERAAEPGRAARVAAGAEVPLRTYRLAFATDPAYAAYFGSANVFAEKVTLMNRVNQIYLDDLAIKMVLVDGTDTLLNFDTAAKATGEDGPCGADPCYDAADLDPETGGCSSALLADNEFALAQTIGADRYDVGHIGLGINGGGIAGLGVVGEQGKAGGCTGLPFPRGDFYAIDYVAHELGHQFAGNHTFNGIRLNCSLTNRNGGTSVEPGSGSSVMAYAGICGQDDLQDHTDPYFSQRSIDEITAHVTAAPTSYAEAQTVSLRGFDADGETVTLSYPGRPDVTITRGPLLALEAPAAMLQLTGQAVTVGGYHGGLAADDDGFTVTFPAGVDVPRIGVAGTTGQGVTASVGVDTNGGPGTNQGVVSATGNHAPSVTAPGDRTIPTRTPFTLTGTAVDVDGDPLVHLWEQNDEGSVLSTGGTALTSNSKADGPLFRVFGTRADVSLEDSLLIGSPGQNRADTSPTRTFPDLAQVLAGRTNAETGSCPAAPADPEAEVPLDVVECYSEFLPTAGRLGRLTFRLTARDQAPEGGGTQYDDTVLTVATGAGPFLVTARETAGPPAVAGGTETITWAVNGTDAAGLAPQVRITLSTDGGRSYPHVLLASTPNDGSAEVVWPQLSTGTARLRVEAVDNYFFDVNDADFAIADRSAPETRATSGPADGSFLLRSRAVFQLASDDAGASYACTLDGAPLPCGPRTVVRGLAEGQHTFTAAARDATGNADPTPLVRRVVVPLDDRRLVRATKGWRGLRVGSAYRRTLLEATRPGRVLTLKVTGARSLALVAPRGPRSGAVRVLAGKRTFAFVDLSTRRTQSRAVIALGRFGRPFTGRVRIVTIGDRPVLIDGLGVYRG